MGFVFGIAAAAVFGLSAVCNRIGMRVRPDDDGLMMTVTINVIVLGVPLLFLGLPRLDGIGLAAFATGGLTGTYLGRFTNLKAIRRVGPARANAFLTSSPIVSALLGWLVLGETVAPGAAAGAALVLIGLRFVVRTTGSNAPAAATILEAAPPRDRPTTSSSPRSGFLWAGLAPLFFGSAFVFRKVGMNTIPDVLLGAFLGALSALVALVVVDVLRDRVSERIHDNFRHIPWWFVAGGVGTSAALILQFLAYFDLPAWVVSLLQGTQGMWTLFWSFLFLRREEHLSWRLALGVALVVGGVSIVTLQS